MGHRNVKRGSISCVRMVGGWPNLGELALRHTQRPGSIFFPCPCQKDTEKPTQHSLLQQLPRKHLIGDIAMVIVKLRLRWPHTWRYALNSLSSPTMTSGPSGINIYSRSGEVRRDSLKQIQAIFGGELVLFN